MKPTRLQYGDKIGIISPSSPVTKNLKTQFDTGIDFLKSLGFQVHIAPNALSNSLGYSSSPREKAEDIHTVFRDPTIKAIICSQGGANTNSCLSFIDWDIIRHNPKILLGISDITVLLNAIYAMTELVTFHGNDVMWGFGRNPTQYDKQEFLDRLVNGKTGLIVSNAERKTIRTGIAEGTLLGGNIHAFLRLARTPYFPDIKESILFFEAIGISPEECESAFYQLKQMGVFEDIQGVIIGYIDGLQGTEKAQMEDILLHVSEECSFPIVKVNDFGHNCPNTVLPVGARIKLNARKKEIEIIKNCVT